MCGDVRVISNKKNVHSDYHEANVNTFCKQSSASKAKVDQ